MDGGDGLRNGIANARALLSKGLRRDRLLLSSGRRSRPRGGRSPEDVMVFASLLGLTVEAACAALARSALAALKHGERRRQLPGGVALL